MDTVIIFSASWRRTSYVAKVIVPIYVLMFASEHEIRLDKV
jgi:hypothetical protein